jgi:superfamily II DNA/RNA helicase
MPIRITKIDVFQEGPVRVMPIQKFEDAGLHPAMAKNIALAKYTVPTPIQKYCIPAIRAGHDLIAIAQTGTCTYVLLPTSHLIDSFRIRQDRRLHCSHP